MKSILAVTMLLLAFLASAASLTTIQLNNRPAAEVIPVIEPMLESGDVISGQGFTLFLRASPQTVDDVRQMLSVIDAAAQVLQISVFQGSRQELERLDISGSILIEGDNGSIGVGTGGGDSAGNIALQNDSITIEGSAGQTRETRQNSPVHRVRVTDGSEAFIQTGQQIAYYSGEDGSGYKNVTTGFRVLPRLRGNEVTLRIRPFRNTLADEQTGTIDTQSAVTTISGTVGRWLPVGGVSQQQSYSQSSIGGYSSGSSSREDQIWIRADLTR